MDQNHDNLEDILGLSSKARKKLFYTRVSVPAVRTLHGHFAWIYMLILIVDLRMFGFRPVVSCFSCAVNSGWRDTAFIWYFIQ